MAIYLVPIAGVALATCLLSRCCKRTSTQQITTIYDETTSTLLAQIRSLNSISNPNLRLQAYRRITVPNGLPREVQEEINEIFAQTIQEQEVVAASLAPARVNRPEEKKAPEMSLAQRYASRAVYASMNQFSNRQAVSSCTACAAAFLQHVGVQQDPLSQPTIEASIRAGQTAHRQIAGDANINLDAMAVLEPLGLQERELGDAAGSCPKIHARQDSPEMYQALEQDYLKNLIPALQQRARQEGMSRAIFTHQPYSAALVCRHKRGNFEYIFFDSHGEAPSNRAFAARFDTAANICKYLAHRYGYDTQSIDTPEYMNPNAYIALFVKS